MFGNKFTLVPFNQMPRVITQSLIFGPHPAFRYNHIAHLFLLGRSKSFCGRFATPQKYALPGFRCSQGQKELRYIHKVQLQNLRKTCYTFIECRKSCIYLMIASYQIFYKQKFINDK
jgi:hypothetical protein